MHRHARSHSKAKPYSCNICKQQYADKKRLNDHMLKHENVKPFICEVCGKTYRRQDNLKVKTKYIIQGVFLIYRDTLKL